MKAILRTSDLSENIIVVDVIKNPVSANINLAKVKYKDETFLTGGILIPFNTRTINILNKLSNKDQWVLLLSCKFPMLFN